MCHGERGLCLLWKAKCTHGASTKKCHAHILTRLVGLWDRGPLGCCGNPSPLVHNSRENMNIYTSTHKYMQVHTRLFFMWFVFLLLQAELSPVTLVKNMKKMPSQHVAPCNGNEGYSLPTRARIATGGTYPGGGDGRLCNAIAFEDPIHSRSEGAKAPIAIHIKIPVRRGRLLPLGLSPRRM